MQRRTVRCDRKAAGRKTNSRLGIVRRRMGLGKPSNRPASHWNAFISTDAVHRASEHQALIVKGIAGNHDRAAINRRLDSHQLVHVFALRRQKCAKRDIFIEETAR